MTPPALPDGYEHGTTRAYRHCKPACAACKAANTAAASARRAARLAAGMPETAHGKPSGYTDYNCRCKRCKKAYRASAAKGGPRSKSKPDRDLMSAGDHGTTRGYTYWNCLCEPCRAVGSALRAEAKARKRAEAEGPSSVRRYRYRIYPKPATQKALRRVFGSCRFVYNAYVALARDRYASGEKHPTAYDASKILVTAARKAPETAWLGEVAHSVLSAAVHDASDAYRRFFDSAAGRTKGKSVGRPKFKSRKSARRAARFPEGSFTIRGGWQNTSRGGGRLHLARINQDIHVNWHRPLPGYASAVTVTEDPDGKFWVSFIVRVPTEAAKVPTRGSRVAGVDVGIADYASIAYTDGTREKIANPRHFERAAERVRRADKNLSRKQPGSNNYAKSKKARARVLRRVANLRENHARQLASKLSRENQTVCIETLNIASMVDSGHTKRSKRINDAGWGQFFRFLEEACDRKGVTLVKAPVYLPTTQVCSICGVNGGKKPVDIREWECLGCGTLLDRDYNAAVNILAAGPAVDACGRDVRLRLAGAAPSEAGSRRNEARAGVSRRRKRAPRRLVEAHAQATSEPRKLKGFRPVVENRAA
ncbi:transposase [Microbacterium marinum]|uniref:RNA-guided endonuclease InsQ/TnpB family protein n=1 Tax=Microbacterium marinum TaxID=421115 RepID=UPI00384E7A09